MGQKHTVQRALLASPPASWPYADKHGTYVFVEEMGTDTTLTGFG